jgi:hypothetical protein
MGVGVGTGVGVHVGTGLGVTVGSGVGVTIYGVGDGAAQATNPAMTNSSKTINLFCVVRIGLV